jgi:hypothetical protein
VLNTGLAYQRQRQKQEKREQKENKKDTEKSETAVETLSHLYRLALGVDLLGSN